MLIKSSEYMPTGRVRALTAVRLYVLSSSSVLDAAKRFRRLGISNFAFHHIRYQMRFRL